MLLSVQTQNNENDKKQSKQAYLNSYIRNMNTIMNFYSLAITFMLNGYGDIVPFTHCGRIIAIIVGVVVSDT